MSHQVVTAMIFFSLAASAFAGDGAKVRKPHLDVRATPSFAFTPARVLVTAQLRGGDDVEEFYCPALVWDWDDGGRSAHQPDCPPFEAGAPLERRFTAEHAYTRPGVYNVTVRMLRARRSLATASATVTVQGMGGAGGQ
jgi:hypothetical protein